MIVGLVYPCYDGAGHADACRVAALIALGRALGDLLRGCCASWDSAQSTMYGCSAARRAGCAPCSWCAHAAGPRNSQDYPGEGSPGAARSLSLNKVGSCSDGGRRSGPAMKRTWLHRRTVRRSTEARFQSPEHGSAVAAPPCRFQATSPGFHPDKASSTAPTRLSCSLPRNVESGQRFTIRLSSRHMTTTVQSS